MKNVFILIIAFLTLFSAESFGQTCAPKKFNNCAAVYLNNDMLVDDYSAKGKCTISSDAKGTLHIYSVNFSLTNPTPYDQVAFKVAIRNDQTNTMWMFSDETYQQLPLEKILQKCQMGDSIILLTIDSQYSLPHHEIFVDMGC